MHRPVISGPGSSSNCGWQMLLMLAALVLPPGGGTRRAAAQLVDDIDSLFAAPFVFYNDPDTTLTLETGDFPQSALIDERDFTPAGVGFEANRHDLLFSDTAGLLPRVFETSEAFDIAVDITLEVGSTAPRKETGIRINSGGFDSLFIITTNPAEIVVFGGAVPSFFSFNNTFGINYTPGDTIQLRMVYMPPDMGLAGTIEFLVDLKDDGLGPFSSGVQEFTNLERGILPGSLIGVYGQGAGNAANPSDFVRILFENFDFDGPDLVTGDFNLDGSLNCLDIDALTAEIAAGSNLSEFDLTGDGTVNLQDRDAWLVLAGAANLASGNAYLVGDANLDGSVDVSDFNIYNNSKFTQVAAWCSGDFNADGVVDVSDFNLWNGNKFLSALEQTALVPEPDALGALMAGGLALGVPGWRRRRGTPVHELL